MALKAMTTTTTKTAPPQPMGPRAFKPWPSAGPRPNRLPSAELPSGNQTHAPDVMPLPRKRLPSAGRPRSRALSLSPSLSLSLHLSPSLVLSLSHSPPLPLLSPTDMYPASPPPHTGPRPPPLQPPGLRNHHRRHQRPFPTWAPRQRRPVGASPSLSGIGPVARGPNRRARFIPLPSAGPLSLPRTVLKLPCPKACIYQSKRQTDRVKFQRQKIIRMAKVPLIIPPPPSTFRRAH